MWQPNYHNVIMLSKVMKNLRTFEYQNEFRFKFNSGIFIIVNFLFVLFAKCVSLPPKS